MFVAALSLAFGLPASTDAQGTDAATYQVTFEGRWNTSSTPDGVVGGAHFTTLIGAVHNSNVTFWAPGGTASSGVEQVAELGVTSGFISEYNAVAAANRKALINESGTGATGTSTFTIEASQTHPLVTLLSMIGPSPDWFVGVSGLSLRDSQGQWHTQVQRDLFPYDAGTENGTEFSLSNAATNPQGTITSIRGQGKFSDSPMATLTFVLQTAQPPPPPTPPTPPTPAVVVSFGSSNYEVSEGASVVVSVGLSDDPERELEIPLVVRHLGGATSADYSGVPQSVMFTRGVMSREFEFAAVDDSDEDFGESVAVGFGTLPSGVTAGGETTISIGDDDTPPMSAIAVTDADCGPELCRALTDTPVRFTDESTGPLMSRRWDFGDGVVSAARSVDHSWSSPGFYEVRLWVSDGYRESESALTFLVESSMPAGSCVSDAETLCLQDSRYAVVVDWFTRNGNRGRARVVYAGTNDSGMFSFFEPSNWEVLIKVLDGCGLNGHVWVYGASATTLGYSIRVADTVTGSEKEYVNEPGSPASAITDAISFPDACRQPASDVP